MTPPTRPQPFLDPDPLNVAPDRLIRFREQPRRSSCAGWLFAIAFCLLFWGLVAYGVTRL